MASRALELAGKAAPKQGRLRDLRLLRHLFVLAILLGLPGWAAMELAAIDETVAARGRLDFTGLVSVSSRVEGRIEEVHCREGERVQLGQLLFRLDSRRFVEELEELRREHSALLSSRRLLIARRALLELAVPLDEVRMERHREVLELVEAHRKSVLDRFEGVSASAFRKEDLENARFEFERAGKTREVEESTYELDRIERKVAMAEIDTSVAEIDRRLSLIEAALPLAVRNITDTEIRAPIDGIVLTANPERLLGRLAETGETIIDMADPEQLYFVMHVDEREITKIVAEQRTFLLLDAFPYYIYRRFEGRVIEKSHDPEWSELSGRSSFRVLIQLDANRFEHRTETGVETIDLRPGLTGEGHIVVRPGLDIPEYVLRRLEKVLPKSWTIY